MDGIVSKRYIPVTCMGIAPNVESTIPNRHRLLFSVNNYVYVLNKQSIDVTTKCNQYECMFSLISLLSPTPIARTVHVRDIDN